MSEILHHCATLTCSYQFYSLYSIRATPSLLYIHLTLEFIDMQIIQAKEHLITEHRLLPLQTGVLRRLTLRSPTYEKDPCSPRGSVSLKV